MKIASRKSKASSKTAALRKGRLELIPRTLAELPMMLMGRLYFRPHGGIRRTLTSNEEKRRAEGSLNTYRFLREYVWSADETVVNKSLEGLLMATPPEAVSAALKTVAPTSGLKSPVVCKLRYPKRLNKVVGEPDFVLWDAGRSALVIGEIKIGAKSGNGRYSFQQLLKYMNLGLLARGALGIKHVTHLIVLPSKDIAQHCSDADYWMPDTDKDGRLIERARRFPTMTCVYQLAVQGCQEHLESVDLEEVEKCFDRDNPLFPIDTFVTSWKELCHELTTASDARHASHLGEGFRSLQRYGEGRFAVRADAVEE